MRGKQLRTLVRLAPLCVALACCGGRAAVQGGAPTPAGAARPSVEAGCAKWPEVMNAAYSQVLEHPAPADKAEETLAKLSDGGLSVRELVKSLALSDEYKEKFVSRQPPELSARLLYRHLLARAPSAEELRSATQTLSTRGHAALAESLLDSAEYGERFGDSRPPGSRMRPCRFPFKLRREDSFEGGGAMETDVTVEADGQITTSTVVKAPSADKSFCGKVGLWLLDEKGNVLAVTGPPREQQWCPEGQGTGPQERTEQWQGGVPADVLLRAQSIALLQLPASKDPQAQTRENAERVEQIKRPVR
jgi:Phycobilisome Linker polypeptide